MPLHSTTSWTTSLKDSILFLKDFLKEFPKWTCAFVSVLLLGSVFYSVIDYLPTEIQSSKLTAQFNYGTLIPPESEGGTLIPPESEGGTLIPPESEGGTLIPPESEGGTLMPPEFEGETLVPPRSEGETLVPPESEGGTLVPPESEGGTLVPPESEGGTLVPPESEGGTLVPPESEGGTLVPPESEGGTLVSPESEGETLVPPESEGGNLMPPKTTRVISNQLTMPNQPMPSKVLKTFKESLLTILLWTWPLGSSFPLNNCTNSEDSDCFYTTNRSLYSIADAVVISHRDVYMSKDLLPPATRPPQQYWIWFSMESPTNCPNLAIMDNKINLTMSYRLDSDIFIPYGWLERANENFTIPKKSKLVAWVVSNWKTKYRRTNYYLELKKYVPIDVYGKYAMSLPRNETYETLATYKFYLAFENSFHEDYITEKFWRNSLMVGTVPVVMGPPRKNYERLVPPDAFIHVDDFSSPKELARYLQSLDKDEKRYAQYFKWRSRFQPTKSNRGFLTSYCKICRKLKEAPLYRTIPSIGAWFK